MKLRTLWCFLCLNSYVQACCTLPEPFFDRPSYIDLEYGSLKDEISNWEKGEYFSLILKPYIKPEEQHEDNNSDANARTISEKNEADRYAAYLKGAEKFHAQEYHEALEIFTQLKDVKLSFTQKLRKMVKLGSYSWVQEASTYMIARCQLSISQLPWDGYSNPIQHVDQDMLKRAEASYLLYLKEYPQGLYANSARNIRRKILYLSGNQAELNQELKGVMLKVLSPSAGSVMDSPVHIIQEFKYFFHGEIDIAQDIPLLVAYAWLGNQKPKSEEIALLEAREKDFSPYPGLFRYLHALGLYRLKRYEELLEKIPKESLTKEVTSLSAQILRVRAMLQLGRVEEALVALEKMYAVSPEDAVELEIACLKLNKGEGLSLYANNSSFKEEKNLRSFAQFGLTEAELEKGIQMQNVTGDNHLLLVEELAWRYLLSKRFVELSALFSKEQIPSVFSSLKPIVATLAVDPESPEDLVEVGEFISQNYNAPVTAYMEDDEALKYLLPRCQPCQTFKARLESYSSPFSFFRDVVKIVQRSLKKSEAEARALHNIVHCMRRNSSYHTACTWNYSGHEEGGEKEGEIAFRRLHKTYKSSPWAKRTPYYY